MDPVDELLRTDWKTLGIKLAGYAAFRARNLAWRSGNSETLAKGLMPDDIAAQAILSVISGERKWDPNRGPLLPYLKRVVDSLMNHLAESSDNRWMQALMTDDGTDLGVPDFESAADTDTDAKRRIQRLIAAIDGNPELIEVVNAILELEDPRPRYIAERIGKSLTEVNNRLKRLRRLALKASTMSEQEMTCPGRVSV